VLFIFAIIVHYDRDFANSDFNFHVIALCITSDI
jgi:hypothetical protein